MNETEYKSMAGIVRHFSPARDADELHDAYVETGSEDPRVLLGRARFRALDERRRRKRSDPEKLAVGYRTPDSCNVDPSVEIDRSELRQQVREALETLRPSDRALARLLWWEQLTVPEIATALQCSRGAIYSRLRRLFAAIDTNPQFVSIVRTSRL